LYPVVDIMLGFKYRGGTRTLVIYDAKKTILKINHHTAEANSSGGFHVDVSKIAT